MPRGPVGLVRRQIDAHGLSGYSDNLQNVMIGAVEALHECGIGRGEMIPAEAPCGCVVACIDRGVIGLDDG